MRPKSQCLVLVRQLGIPRPFQFLRVSLVAGCLNIPPPRATPGANPSAKGTDQICRLPLQAFHFILEATNPGDLMRIPVRRCRAKAASFRGSPTLQCHKNTRALTNSIADQFYSRVTSSKAEHDQPCCSKDPLIAASIVATLEQRAAISSCFPFAPRAFASRELPRALRTASLLVVCRWPRNPSP